MAAHLVFCLVGRLGLQTVELTAAVRGDSTVELMAAERGDSTVELTTAVRGETTVANLALRWVVV